MGIYSEAHICQCLSGLSTIRRNSLLTIDGNRQKTGEKFVEGVLNLARGLFELGLKPGDVVSISALNSDFYLEWLLAVTFVGGIAAPLNHRWSLEEAKLAMVDVKPVLLVTDMISFNNWDGKFQVHDIPSLRWHVFTNIPTEFNFTGSVLTIEMLKMSSMGSQTLSYCWAPEGAAIICFTSGTTGSPKGVILSHSALIVQSLAKIAVVGYGEDDVYLHMAPLCHIGGISSAIAMLMIGGRHVLMPKFDAKSALQAIEKYSVTSFITVPAMIVGLIYICRMEKTFVNLKTVKKILNGGGVLSHELVKETLRIFQRAKLVTAYGMTEACSSLTFKTLYDPTKEKLFPVIEDMTFSLEHQTGGICVGRPAPHVELRIRIDDSYQIGRILTRGPHVMIRYWGQDITEISHCGDEGWLDTGDIGRIDEQGNLWLIGRAKDRIKSGGENIYPEEVETVLSQHPGVSDVVVVGLPDARLTEKVVACIRMKDTWEWIDFCPDNSAKYQDLCLSSEVLQKFCRKRNLTGFKIPKLYIVWRKPFPLTTTGKLRRDLIRKEVTYHMLFFPSSL